jgi:hypothetical protein
LLDSGVPKSEGILAKIDHTCRETNWVLTKEGHLKGRVEVDKDGNFNVEEYWVKKVPLYPPSNMDEHFEFIKSPRELESERKSTQKKHNKRIKEALSKKQEVWSNR